MPQTRTYQVYKFDELTPEQQAKALDNLRNINVECDDWYEFVLDEAKEDLAKQGYADATIYYSGFASQGDGASFTATVDVAKWLDNHTGLKDQYPTVYSYAADVTMAITRSGHYYHEFSMSIDTDIDFHSIDEDGKYELFDAEISKLEDAVLEDARDEAKRIYRQLEAEYDYQREDSQVKETILANDYDFDEDGSLA